MTTDAVLAAFTLVLGPFAGSFLGLLTLRLPAGRAWAMSRSACGACERPLGLFDLVPLLSFAALLGRCRSCRAPIPRRYPLMEAASLAIALVSVVTQTGPLILVTAILGWMLLVIAVIDAEHLWLPDRLTLPLGLTGAVLTIAFAGAPLWRPLLGAAIGYGALALVAWTYARVRKREGLGGGDPRLLGAIGAWTGWEGLPSVLIWACVAGLSLALAQAIVRRRLQGDQQLPFGTFLALGAGLTWLWGPLHHMLGGGF